MTTEAKSPKVWMETSMNPYAGFWLRFGAAIVDGLILMIPIILLFILLPKEVEETVMPNGQVSKTYYPTAITDFIFGVVFMLYYATFESSRFQATLGKQKFKLIVTNLAGERVSFIIAMFRSWPIWLPFMTSSIDWLPSDFMMLVSCIAVGLTERKQGFHDWMAKCLVVKRGAKFERTEQNSNETAGSPDEAK